VLLLLKIYCTRSDAQVQLSTASCDLAYGVWRVAHESVDVALQTSQVHHGRVDVVELEVQWSVMFEYLIHVQVEWLVVLLLHVFIIE